MYAGLVPHLMAVFIGIFLPKSNFHVGENKDGHESNT